ncbi:flagellar motor stator protein MotA [Lacipirellula parvula]|uniref:Flagellar motor rotation protein MotA n=1 Tax=Lacipirellula parvula TaxID=2650471 RepID=A0A5K7XC42_9BACT|nr:flagellar motor stator protein MotA [Lacipirellula parvula]BBO34394.1 flagellar motor rotation protein MotA [Lacipirellula parvula]
MIVIVGCIVVVGAVLAGFTWAGGHIGALIHPSEIVTIGGASLGALIVMSPKKVLVDLMKGIMQAIKGSPFSKAMYGDLFRLMYDLLRTARREGLLGLEVHVAHPHESSIFTKYPRVANNHHVCDFICSGLTPLVEGTARKEQLPALFAADLKVIEEEHHLPTHALSKTADGLPGFGIVAAVLGIVITMGHIDGPPAEIGHKVGAALVGTFLGILMSYGFVAPLAARMELLGLAEIAFFRTIATIITGFANDLPPKVAIDQARRGVASENRPSREELETMFQEVDAT